MALNITRGSEPMTVETLVMTIYSQPGLGKTSLAFTAKNPLLLDFDQGAYRAVDRKDAVTVSVWQDIANMTAEDLAPYDTIVVDTVGKALDALAVDIVGKSSKFSYGGALNQQGWGQLGIKFRYWLKKLRGFGKDVVLLSHMDEKSDGEAIKERLKIQGGSKDLVLTDSDVIARVSINNRQRELIFSPTETSYGKDPANVGSLAIPDATKLEYRTILDDVLTAVKEGLNELSEEQLAMRSEVEWFENTLPDVIAPNEVNDLIGRAKKAGGPIPKMLADHAASLGFEYDKAEGGYVHADEDELAEDTGTSVTHEEPSDEKAVA